jgi:type IV secretion system protein VirD4
MGPVEDAISLVGGFGVTFWLILQDLSQRKAHYRDRWEMFEGSAQVLQAFGTNDLFTAKHLSERLGDATIQVESGNLSAGISHGRSSARNQSAAQTVAEKGRRLLTADEVMRLPPDQQLLLVCGRTRSGRTSSTT